MNDNPTPSAGILETIGNQTIIPVLTVSSADEAVSLAEKFLAQDYHLIEITLRTGAALDAIRTVKQQLPDIKVAAGTVLHPEQMVQAHSAGADLQVSPGCSYDLYQVALDDNIAYIPGVGSVSEIMSGAEFGFTVFKYFPAEALGGSAAIKAFASIFPHCHFIPTGGINADNMDSYLKLDNIPAVAGSWVADI